MSTRAILPLLSGLLCLGGCSSGPPASSSVQEPKTPKGAVRITEETLRTTPRKQMTMEEQIALVQKKDMPEAFKRRFISEIRKQHRIKAQKAAKSNPKR